MLKNPFAKDAKERIVHVDHADDPARATKPFTCPGCGIEMRRRAQSKPMTRLDGTTYTIRPHFYHVADVECDSGIETSLHLWAKLIIEEAMTVGLPSISISKRGETRDLRTDWTYTSVVLEEYQAGIRPDIVMYHDHGALNVEIRVHHAVDERKKEILLARARSERRSCIEIDLASYDFDETPGDELQRAILYDAHRIWICHQDEDIVGEEIEASYWVRAHQLAEEIHKSLRHVPHRIKQETRDKHEHEIKSQGHAPFVGRDVPLSHWFSAPLRNWQHVVLKTYLNSKAKIDFRMDRLPDGYGPNHAFQNLDLPVDPGNDVLSILGMTPEQYGSPGEAVRQYLSMLCDEPDREVDDPITKRLLVRSSEPGCARIAPGRSEYLVRRRRLFSAFMNAGSPVGAGPAEFAAWGIKPLGRSTPRRICIEGGPTYYRLLAWLHAISNMNDGGWPEPNLLGVGSPDIQERRRREWRRPFKEGGGVQLPTDNHRYCWSTRLMSRRMTPEEILREMAERTHATPANAAAFIETPHDRLGGSTPLAFATDIPSMQACVSLMPTPRDLYGRLAKCRRVW